MKRIILVLMLLSLMLIPKTYAYWETPNVPEDKTISKETMTGTYPFGSISGLIEYSDKNKGYKLYDLIHKEGRYFVVIRPDSCYESTCKDPFSFSGTGGHIPYAEISLEWRALIPYVSGDVATMNGILYKTLNAGSAMSVKPDAKGSDAWFPLDPTRIHLGYRTDAGSYFLYQKEIIKLNFTVYPGESSWTPTSQQGNLPDRYKDAYSPKTKYTTGQAVFHNDKAYYVVNPELANKNAPGTIYGAWNQLDTIEWQAFNTYKKNDAVTYKGKVYQAISDNVQGEPGASLRTWNVVRDINYNQYNVYPAYTVVIHKNAVYHSLKETTNLEPGSKGSESTWKKH